MKTSFSRREWLATTTTTAAATALAGAFSPLLARPQDRGFRIGATDWNLGKMGDPASFEIARQIGLDGVQVSLGSVKNQMHLRRPEVQKAFLDASKRTGVAIASLAIGELNSIALEE